MNDERLKPGDLVEHTFHNIGVGIVLGKEKDELGGWWTVVQWLDDCIKDTVFDRGRGAGIGYYRAHNLMRIS